MSLEELKSDHAAITQQLAEMNPALTTTPELVVWLKANLLPFLENVTNELGEIDDTVRDVYEGADDILQPETGGLFAAVIGTAVGIIGKLKTKLVATNLEDAKAIKAIKEWDQLAAEALETINEITIPDDDEDEDEEAEEEEGDEDADDEKETK